MATTYRKPDVEVLQDFQNLTPQINLATLQTVIVGPSFKKLKEFDNANSVSYKLGTYTRGSKFKASFPELPPGSKINYDSLNITIQNYAGEHKIDKAVFKIDGNSGAVTEIGDDYIVFEDMNVDFIRAGVYYFADEQGNAKDVSDNDSDCIHFMLNDEDCYFEVQDVIDAHHLKLDNKDSRVVTPMSGVEYECSNFGWSLDEEDNIVITTRLSHNGTVYISGSAMRTDYCKKLISVGSVDDLENIFGAGEVTVDNPLAFGLSKVLPYLGSAEIVTGLMVESDDPIGYQKAFEFLESQEVYCIVPLTNNPIVHQMLKEHVVAMSDVLEKRERIALVNSAPITRKIKSGMLGRQDPVTGVYDFARGNITNSGKALSDSVVSEYKEYIPTENMVSNPENPYVTTTKPERAVVIYRDMHEGDAILYSYSDNPDSFRRVNMNEDGIGFISQNGSQTIAKIKFIPSAISENDKKVCIHMFSTKGQLANTSFAYGVAAAEGTELTSPNIEVPANRKCLRLRLFNQGELVTTGSSRTSEGVDLPVSFDVTLEGTDDVITISASGIYKFNNNIRSVRMSNNQSVSEYNASEAVVDILMLSNGGNYKLDLFVDADASFLSDNVAPGVDQLVIVNKEVEDNSTYSGYAETRYLIDEVLEEDTVKIKAVYNEDTSNFEAGVFTEKNDPSNPLYYRVESPVITNKRELAEAYRDMSEGFGCRRLTHVFAPTVGVYVDNTTIRMVPGYYFACAIAGATQAYPAQQGFTNMNFGGFTKVSGTNDTFSESQMDIIASGGTLIVIQPNVNSALTIRHQLTTDMSSVETKEYSVTKAVDYMAKMARSTYRPYIGRYVINKATLELLYKVGTSLVSRWLTEGVALEGTYVDKFQVDPEQGDRVYACFQVKVPLPLNYIRLIFLV